ncbi:Dual specificity phosphatase, catalytic domain [Methylomagnum ishizawai]|uniref:Dual specificity phosphatase, catalytic domain n=1 Tax=Methylomagnum ishizawai TaxID=1760988 RepID=A0A1Y6D1Y0_9GAMM|nr:dual specificity protein phosphatase family protein [Methylomagnum ishizawai]SMF96637.1 Dual specificity phosphatase, catalytic domain [Methylomagnum ishizawai]
MKPEGSIQTELRRLGNMLGTHGPCLTLLAGLDKAWRWLTGAPIWHFSGVAPGVLLGGQPARRIVDQMYRRGVTGVVNLRAEYDYVEEVGGTGLDYLFLPVADNHAPSLDQLRQGVAFIRRAVAQGGKVYIHCWEGLGRGPTLAAAWLVSAGDAPTVAWDRVRKVRPFIRPTAGQVRRIEEFAAGLRVVSQA